MLAADVLNSHIKLLFDYARHSLKMPTNDPVLWGFLGLYKKKTFLVVMLLVVINAGSNNSNNLWEKYIT